MLKDVGKCNREVNCVYHFTPKHYFADHFALPERPPNTILPLPRKPPAQTFTVVRSFCRQSIA
ncbi:hypothetical protein [Runella salmonicolor]|uniref:hypothetical protein n=1 Tax=Runella salmonicolor TaxID=2950278 RepID=UPI0035B656C6